MNEAVFVGGRSAVSKSRGISGVCKAVTGEQGLAIMNAARASTVSLDNADSVTDAGRVKVGTDVTQGLWLSCLCPAYAVCEVGMFCLLYSTCSLL